MKQKLPFPLIYWQLQYLSKIMVIWLFLHTYPEDSCVHLKKKNPLFYNFCHILFSSLYFTPMLCDHWWEIVSGTYSRIWSSRYINIYISSSLYHEGIFWQKQTVYFSLSYGIVPYEIAVWFKSIQWSLYSIIQSNTTSCQLPFTK